MENKMGKRLSKDVVEARAIANDHTCACGCDKGCSGFKDEPTDMIEKLSRVTLSEQNQQQQGSFECKDPVDVLMAIQEGAPDGIERRLAQRE